MNIKDICDNIKTSFETDLPALLSVAGLDDFAKYNSGSALRSDDLELSVYPDYDNDLTDVRNQGIIIQIQLYGIDKGKEYDTVLLPYIKETFTAGYVDATTRMGVESDFWPIDISGNTAYVYYSVSWQTDLDDCD